LHSIRPLRTRPALMVRTAYTPETWKGPTTACTQSSKSKQPARCTKGSSSVSLPGGPCPHTGDEVQVSQDACRHVRRQEVAKLQSWHRQHRISLDGHASEARAQETCNQQGRVTRRELRLAGRCFSSA
jgi:hypothetical protein